MAVTGKLQVGDAGQKSREITLMLDSGATYTAYLKCDAFATYTVKPQSLDFGQLRINGDSDDQSVDVRTAIFSSLSARISEPPTPDVAWLTAATQERSDGTFEVSVHVLRENLAYGLQFGRLVFVTSDATRRQFTIPVRIQGVADLRPVPARVFLRAGDEKTVRVLKHDGASARISAIRADRQCFAASPGQSDGEVCVRAGVDAVGESGTIWIDSEEGFRTKVLVTVMANWESKDQGGGQ